MKYASLEAINRAIRAIEYKVVSLSQVGVDRQVLDYFCNFPGANDAIPAATAPQAVHLTPLFLPGRMRLKYVNINHHSASARRTEMCLYKGAIDTIRTESKILWTQVSKPSQHQIAAGVYTSSTKTLEKELLVDPSDGIYALGYQVSGTTDYYGFQPFAGGSSNEEKLGTLLCPVSAFGVWPTTLTGTAKFPSMRVSLFSASGFRATGFID